MPHSTPAPAKKSAEPGDKFVPNIKMGDGRGEDDRVCVMTWVKLIHYEWVVNFSAVQIPPISPELLIEQLIREARTKDPYKGGKAVGAKTVPAEDFKQ